MPSLSVYTPELMGGVLCLMHRPEVQGFGKDTSYRSYLLRRSFIIRRCQLILFWLFGSSWFSVTLFLFELLVGTGVE